MATPSPTDAGALANRINKATRSAHTHINNLVNALSKTAARDPQLLKQVTISFYHVFNTFEQLWTEEMHKNDSPVSHVLKQVWHPSLARTTAIRADLLSYFDMHMNDRELGQPSLSKQQDFVDYIRYSVKQKPHVLLAYGHVMYMALFAGGRIMRAHIMRTSAALAEEKNDAGSWFELASVGPSTFRFDVKDEDSLRLSFKAHFEECTRDGLSERQKQDVIQESLEVFRRYSACIDQIRRVNRRRSTGVFTRNVTLGLVIFCILLYLVLRKWS